MLELIFGGEIRWSRVFRLLVRHWELIGLLLLIVSCLLYWVFISKGKTMFKFLVKHPLFSLGLIVIYIASIWWASYTVWTNYGWFVAVIFAALMIVFFKPVFLALIVKLKEAKSQEIHRN